MCLAFEKNQQAQQRCSDGNSADDQKLLKVQVWAVRHGVTGNGRYGCAGAFAGGGAVTPTAAAATTAKEAAEAAAASEEVSKEVHAFISSVPGSPRARSRR